MALRTLGGLGLSGVSFRRPKPLLLLAYLTLEGPQDRRFLAELLWPHAADPRQSLSVAASQLRAAAPGALRAEAGRLWTRLECDALLLREAAANQEWQTVVDLYGGPFLAGLDLDDGNVELEEWLYGTRELLASHAQHALVELAERSLAGGNRRAAASLAERAAAMRDETDGDDDALLARLYALLVATSNPRAPALRQEAAAIGLELAADEAPQRRATAHNLPVPLTSFIGRTGQLAELKRLLDEGQRLVTIVGFGGNGKTRLSLALGHQLLAAQAFDQICFVSLETVTDPERLLPQVAAALGAPPGAHGPLEDLRGKLGERRALLILDNLEQVAAGAPRLLELLEACPGTSLLVTSREPLELPPETLFLLEGMTLPPDARAALAEPERYDGLGLYLNVARRFDPRFQLDAENVAATLRVCQLVDGSPLGLELAAALARVIPAQELAAELEANLDVLVSTLPAQPVRHSSLRAIFERTWALLTDAERSALAGSAVFHGGFTRDAAEAVVGMDLALLSALLDRSLLRRHAGRYYLHPVVKQYAREKLTEEPVARELRDRHAAHYLALLASKAPFDLTAGQRQAFEELDRDHADLRAAWEWAAESGRTDLLEPTLQLLSRYLITRGRLRELSQLLARAEAAAPEGSLLTALVMRMQAHIMMRNDAPGAQALLERALPIVERHGSDLQVAQIRFGLGMTMAFLGDPERARRFMLEALPALERHDDRELLGACLSNLGMFTADRDEEDGWIKRAVATSRRTGNTADLVKLLNNLAVTCALGYGDHRASIGFISEAIELEREEIGRPYLLAYFHCYAAYHHTNAGDEAGAARHAAAATRLLAERQPGEEYAFRDGLKANWAQGHVHYLRGDTELARAAAQQAAPEGNSYELLAWLALEAGDAQAAEEHRQAHLAALSPLTSVRARAHWLLVADLLRVEVLSLSAGGSEASGGLSAEALATLRAALAMIVAYRFVPLALEGFTTAYALAPAVTGDRLLAVAAHHPAARYHTRRRAGGLLQAREAGGGARGPASEPKRAAVAGLTPDALLTLARELDQRLGSAHVQVTEP